MKKRTICLSPRLPGLAAILAATFALSACGSLAPTPYTQDEIAARVEQDQKAMYADQEPVTGPIDFYEAAARSLKYNLDHRLKLMENALATSLHDVSKHEMLPRIVANAGYLSRSNDSGGRSIGIEDRIESLRPSTSEERHRTVDSLTFSWNALDFGVSYLRAHQKADQVLMAEERRRKVVQNVLQDLRNSYWRALGAQRLLGRVNAQLDMVNKALVSARQVEDRGLVPKVQILAYQRALLDAVNMLTMRRQDLELARAELAALMSLPPGTEFTLADDGKEEMLPKAPTNMARLERLALENRPEIMEEWYRRRVTENDIRAAKLLVWPNLGLDFGPHYDSNKYLHNNHWNSTSINLSWNIMKLAQLPALERAHEDQNKTDDLRRMALSMAVLTQVRVGTLRYELSLSELDYAKESYRVDQEMLQYAKAALESKLDSRLEVIRAEARAMLAEYQLMVSYANAQAAWGRVYNSVGLDVLPQEIDSHDIKTIAKSIASTLGAWNGKVFEVNQ